MSPRPQFNIGKRLAGTRSWFSDPEEERIFGWILFAVAYQNPVHAQSWTEGKEPNWERLTNKLPRRFGPYLGWLAAQTRWWRRGFERDVLDPWLQSLAAHSTEFLGGTRRPQFVSSTEIEPLFKGESDLLHQRPEERLMDDHAGAFWLARYFGDIVDWARSTRSDINSYSLLAAYAESQRWMQELGKRRGRITWVDRGRSLMEWKGGWSLQDLGSEQLQMEALAMRNCLEDFVVEVRAEEAFIYSLRDPDNQPHINVEWTQMVLSEWDDLDPENRAILVAKEDELYSLGHHVRWVLGGQTATALDDGVEIWSMDLEMPWRVAQVRGRDNAAPKKLAYCQMVIEGLLEEHGEDLLLSYESWGELRACSKVLGLPAVFEIIEGAGYDVPEWMLR